MSAVGTGTGDPGNSDGGKHAAISDNKLRSVAGRSPAHRIHVALIEPDAAIQTDFSKALVAAGPEWQLTSYSTLEQAIEAFVMAHPNLVVIGGNAGASRVAAILEVRAALRHAPVIVLADSAETSDVLLCLKAGAHGFVLKPLDPEIAPSLSRVLRGEHVLCPTALEGLLHCMQLSGWSGSTHGLSTREQEVIALLATNASDKEICQKLGTSEATIHCHVSAILHKLGLHDRHAAARFYLTGLN